MPMSEGVKGAIWGGALTAVVFGSINWLLYTNVYKPQLETQRQMAKTAADGLELTRGQLRTAAQQRSELEQRLTDLAGKWQAARNKFVIQVGQDISTALTPPPTSLDRGQPPPPTVIEIAQKLIRDRDAAREELLQIQNGVQRIYDRLDTEIDAIRDRLTQQPPPTEEEIRQLVQQLQTHWNDRVRDVNDIVDVLLQSLGCPLVVASNP
jgi:DNA repair exonuclease SbcCD ATPase subunit